VARISAIGKPERSGSDLIPVSQVRCQCHEMTGVPTMPVSTLQRMREICLEEGLKYVHVGHVPDDGNQDAICPACGRVVTRRQGFAVTNRIRNGRCPDCGASIAGIGVGGE
jgi:pyruvate formate lyase activating enzyme